MKTNEALKALDLLNKFKVIGMLQYRTLREFILQSEESDFFATTVDEVANIVADTPDLYSQDGGGGRGTQPLWGFMGEDDQLLVRGFVRATNRVSAKQRVLAEYPNARFFR